MLTVCDSNVMFWTLKRILVKVNRTSQSLDYFRDYCLVILINGIQFSWTDFTVQQLFWFLVGNKDKTCRYIHAKLKRTVKTKCCVKKTKRNQRVFKRRNHLLSLKWKDTRDVVCLSTPHEMTKSNVEVRCNNGVKTK